MIPAAGWTSVISATDCRRRPTAGTGGPPDLRGLGPRDDNVTGLLELQDISVAEIELVTKRIHCLRWRAPL